MKLPAREYFIEKEVPLSRAKVWELVSDTDHLNRVIGLFSVQAGNAVPAAGGFYRALEARVARLIPLRWNEFPFRWSKYSHYSVVRRYRGGPMKEFHGGVRLRDGGTLLPDGSPSTIVTLFARFTPRNLLGMAAIPVVGQRSMKNTMTYLTAFLKLNPEEKVERLPEPRRRYPCDERELERRFGQMGELPVDHRFEGLFRDHLRYANDDEVVDINPYHLADRWNASRRELLRWFLYATSVGITNLSWHLICPNCRVAKVDAASLSEVTAEFHCDFCGIDYTSSFDRFVELTFTVHPRIRAAVKNTYCVGGPTITPHIYVQAIIERGSEEEVDVPEEPSEYRIRVLQRNDSIEVRKTGEAAAQPNEESPIRLRYTANGWEESDLDLPAGCSSVMIRNEGERDIVVASEKTDWSTDAPTAAAVTAMAEFRRMFSSEVLAPGRQIGIESVTLMFTDLRESTSFYEAVGDAPAYGRVQRHFSYLAKWIEANDGTVVKTIGDAVMAVFVSPEAGVAAAVAAQRNLHRFNADAGSEGAIVLKIGLHAGPAIVVNLNDRLDYFGRTVNIAARVQGTSAGGDVVLSNELMSRSAVRAYLAGERVPSEAFTAELKGVEGRARLYRLTL